MDFNEICVLIVDDDPHDIEICQFHLQQIQQFSIRTVVAANKEEAIIALKEQEVDCVLMDYRLTGKTGVEILKEIQATLGKEIPTIIFTSAYNDKVYQEALDAGAYNLLIKDQVNTKVLERSISFVVERAKINHYLQDAKTKALEANQLKSKFLAQVSHEVRNPIHQVLGLTDFLLEDAGKGLTEEHLEFVTMIHSAAEHMLRLVDQLLDLAKLEAGKMQVNPRNVEVRPLLNKVVKENLAVAKRKNLPLTLTIDPQLPPFIETDDLHFSQILNNLVSNALKFTTEGEVKIHAFIPTGDQVLKDIARETPFLAISVTDSGIGIPHEKLNTLFSPYEQTSSKIRKEFGGTGLGLAIVKEMADLLYGHVRVSSEQGQGARFTLYLPVKFSKAKHEKTRQYLSPLRTPTVGASS